MITRARRMPVTRLLLVTLIALVLALYAFPYAYLVLTSVKPAIEAVAIPPTVLPSRLDSGNYERILSDPAITGSFGNSIVIATMSTALALLLAIPAAYGVTRFGTRLGQVFTIGVLLTRMVPYVSIGIPFVAIMRSLNLSDTHLAVALAHTTINLPLAIWLMASFFEGLPAELEEAARVDGCTRLGALVRVILPLAAGGIAVTAIFAFLASWSEFLFALLLTSVDAKTAPVVVAQFKSQFSIDWGTMTALSTLYSLPVVVLALILQRRIVAGLTLGAVKG